ncbi:nuclear condensin complex subunit Smc2, putative [Rhizoctonia solani AG-1 IA]|uniref:Nuclear condensin complex subunit Smc2, putative n=1 Tax=Thanatephorus cucumeris (strain AG1-IA) TaxID=983506 RepID=L8WMB0_THACA|nr:nuclear condensin complex subunit Smc2, putative [Rhizoctonia solani AG-1 IA]
MLYCFERNTAHICEPWIGFKSYPTRTTIRGWDPSFNAITGLNGTGKSNILDAISFVLGLTDYKELRASNWQELIYKKGAAGVTKASVTIVFDNSDPASSPPGMQALKQITVTRQVLNMGPREILGLIEEASGTRMYEEKKEKALRTISKKEKKVEDIEALLAEEINPKLVRLRKEKESYLAYTKAVSESERLGRLVSAFQYTDYRSRLNQRKSDISTLSDHKSTLERSRKDKGKEQAKMSEEEAEVTRRRDEEMHKDGKMRVLEEEMAKCEKDVAKVLAQEEIVQGVYQENTKKVEEVKVALMNDSLEASRTALATKSAAFNSAKETQSAAQQSLTTAEELSQSLSSGLSGMITYQSSIAEAKNRAAAAGTEADQSAKQLQLAQAEIRDKENRVKKIETEGREGREAVDKEKKEIDGLRGRLEKMGWTKERRENAEQEVGMAIEEARKARDADRYRALLSQLDFAYSDPTPNFDRSAVLGPLGNLISLTPEVADKWSTALEICAGAKIYNVVVRDERIGSQLLKHGQLRKRVTLIPLNKISPPRVTPVQIAAAKKIAPGKVFLALELISFPPEARPAMEFAFGDTLICADDETAKKVTYDPIVRMRSVTIHGSLYDPSGTLSGGSAPQGAGILKKVQDVIRCEARVKEFRAREVELKKKLEEWGRIEREMDGREDRVMRMEKGVGGDSSKLTREIEELKRTIMQLESTITGAKERKQEAQAEAAKLEKDMKEFGGNKESKLKELKADIVKKRSDLAKKTAHVKDLQKEVQVNKMLKDRSEQMDADIEKATEEVEAAQTAVKESQEQIRELKGKRDKVEASKARSVVAAKLDKEKAALKAYQTQLDALATQIGRITQQISDIELEIKTADHDLANATKEKSALESRIAELAKLNPWFADEERNFGKKGGEFDFSAMDMQATKEAARRAEEQSKGMKKKVNSKVMHMIEGVEKKDKELQERISMVQKDKLKIEATIQDRARLGRTPSSANDGFSQFGQIFAELLPSNFAKLQPPEGKELTDGLEVKVLVGNGMHSSKHPVIPRFNVAGRSLVALSLIMALLQFKPAPMYILDEIDAALDLSHTQHIGTLFRNRFRGSQFVVVSLKEGLFTNANVLFRTRFRDNTSIVERTAQRSNSALYEVNTAAGGSSRPRGQATRVVAGPRVGNDASALGFQAPLIPALSKNVSQGNTLSLGVSATMTTDLSTIEGEAPIYSNLATMFSTSASALPSSCHVCPLPCIYFTGGIKTMTHIDGCLLDRRHMQHVYILNGRSGFGKTQIALKYAQTRGTRNPINSFSDILFIDGSSQDTVKQSYTSFIVNKGRGTSMEDSLRWLSSNKTNWLIILDGADAPDLEFRSLLPSCSHASGGNINESCQLYREQFLERLQEAHARSGARRSPCQNLVEAACLIAFPNLDTHSLNFLRVLAFMHPRGISEEIFRRAADGLSTYTSSLPPTETEDRVTSFLKILLDPFLDGDPNWNGTAFMHLMAEMLDRSFLDFVQPGALYSVPPCIHDIVARTQIPDAPFYCRIATHLLALAIDPSRDDNEELKFRQLIASHVNSVLIQGENVSLDEAARFVLVYMTNGQLEEAETLQLEVLEFRRRMLGEDHHLTLDSQDRLDTIYRMRGKEAPNARFIDEDYLASLPHSQLSRPLNDIVKHFTLVSRLRDLTHELGPYPNARTSWGGIGDIYRGALHDGTEVAIKTLRRSRTKSESKITKYTAREIAAWSKLDHPNILEFLGLAVFQNQLVMVSPWMHYGDVVEFATQRGANRCSLCLQLSSAVAYMHSMHTVHGDIKGVSYSYQVPSRSLLLTNMSGQANALVSEDGIVKLTDFGLTILQEPDVYISFTEKGGGTERWMVNAPELLLEEAAVRSEKADVYEIFTGLPPFSDVRRNAAVVAMISRGEGPRYPNEMALYTRHSDRVWEMLQQCWRQNPAERPTAEQIKAVFYEIM